MNIRRTSPGTFFALCGALALSLMAGCTQRAPEGGTVEIDITHLFDAQPLQLNDSSYPTAGGDRIGITRLRYYLSNIRLRRHDGSWYVQPSGEKDSSGYYLVDAGKPDTLKLRIPLVTPGDYEGLDFLIGVDAARNGKGAQSGTLDPVNGMFWTWTSGYIFFQLEGLTPAGQDITWHVGGRTEPTLARSVYLPLGERPLQVKPPVLSTIHLQVDVAEAFRTPTEIDLDTMATAMDSKSGAIIADNIADMFRVDHLHHEPVRP